MDLSTILGLVLGFGGILAGHLIEGGHVGSLVQLAAFFIVFGGTLGATLVSNRATDFALGLKMFSLSLKKDDEDTTNKLANEIVTAARVARKESILALEKRLAAMSNPFMKSVFRFLIDGVDAPTLKDIFETEIINEERRKLAGAKVWTDAGGYAPTIGIIGAVLGLIHVMANLSNTSELGKGIAVAFVATVYGVGSANLLFLPIANKIKRKVLIESGQKEMILEGALSIIKGFNPYVIEHKVRSFQVEPPAPALTKQKK